MGFLGDVKNWLVGGDASKQFQQASAPQYSNFAGGYIQNALGGLGNRSLDFGQADQSRGQMGTLAQQLQGVSAGTSAGAGELAVNRQMGAAQAAQQSLARQARGANAVLAARQAARNTAGLGVAGAGQAQMAALQDQAAARGQLAGLLGNMRGQDLSQQGLVQQQQGQNAQQQLGYLSQLLGIDQMKLQQALAQQQVNAGDQGHLASLLQAAGTTIGAVYGGPKGAEAGGQIGGAVGSKPR